MQVEKRRVLLVDDEEALLDLGHAMLTRLGCDVVPCATSPEALETFAAAPARFDLVVADYTMPALTGAQLGVACQHLRPDLPVLLVTGWARAPRGRARPGAGADGCPAEAVQSPRARWRAAATLGGTTDGGVVYAGVA